MQPFTRSMSMLAIALSLGGFATTAQTQSLDTPQAQFQRALEQTDTENWQGAIANFNAAAEGFQAQDNPLQATVAATTARYLDWWNDWRLERERTSDLQTVEPIPQWVMMGSCMGSSEAEICDYALQFVQAERDMAEGVMLLQRHLRHVPLATGGAYAVFSIEDAQAVTPPLQAGEHWLPLCRPTDGSDRKVVAIVQTQGYEDSLTFPEIREAWWIDYETETLQRSVAPTDIVCENPCPGGC